MANWRELINVSLHGRRIGLAGVSTAKHGGRVPAEFLVGPDGFRHGVSTADSTGTNILPYGVHFLNGTSAGSSAVYTLDPPIPGVPVWINIGTTANGPCYLKTKNSETINTTLGSSHTTIKSSVGGGYCLLGVTTAVWMGMGITSGTSSQAGGHVLTTST